jgi:hypothetical protein
VVIGGAVSITALPQEVADGGVIENDGGDGFNVTTVVAVIVHVPLDADSI